MHTNILLHKATQPWPITLKDILTRRNVHHDSSVWNTAGLILFMTIIYQRKAFNIDYFPTCTFSVTFKWWEQQKQPANGLGPDAPPQVSPPSNKRTRDRLSMNIYISYPYCFCWHQAPWDWWGSRLLLATLPSHYLACSVGGVPGSWTVAIGGRRGTRLHSRVILIPEIHALPWDIDEILLWVAPQSGWHRGRVPAGSFRSWRSP